MQSHKSTTIIYALLGLFMVCLMHASILYPDQIYAGHDNWFHVLRLNEYFKSVQAGDLTPKIFQNMANGYGYAADIFYPSIFLLPYALLRFLGLDCFQAYNGYHLIITALTFLMAYFSCVKMTGKARLAQIFALLYTLSAYRLTDDYVRSALGETLSFIFLPLVMLSLHQIFVDNRPNWKLLALSMSLLIHAHLLSAMMTAFMIGLLLVYVGFSYGHERLHLSCFLKAGLVSLLASLWIILPIMEQSHFSEFRFQESGSFNLKWMDYFGLAEVLQFSLKNDANVGNFMRPNVGFLLIMPFLMAVISWYNLRADLKKLTLLSGFCLLLSTSTFPWFLLDHTPLATVQFTWRYLMFTTYALALLGALLVDDWLVRRSEQLEWDKFHALVICVIVAFSYNYLHQIRDKSLLEQDSWIRRDFFETPYHTSIGQGMEYLPLNMDPAIIEAGPFQLPHQDQVELKIHKLQMLEGNQRAYQFESPRDQTIQLPITAYAGYQASINGSSVPGFPIDGLLSLNVPEGESNVVVKYKKTKVQRFSGWVSGITWIGLVFGWLRQERLRGLWHHSNYLLK